MDYYYRRFFLYTNVQFLLFEWLFVNQLLLHNGLSFLFWFFFVGLWWVSCFEINGRPFKKFLQEYKTRLSPALYAPAKMLFPHAFGNFPTLSAIAEKVFLIVSAFGILTIVIAKIPFSKNFQMLTKFYWNVKKIFFGSQIDIFCPKTFSLHFLGIFHQV